METLKKKSSILTTKYIPDTWMHLSEKGGSKPYTIILK